MNKPNFSNGTIWTGDNLVVMRGMNDACVDLIYLDPPFNSNRTYEAPIGSKAAGAAFKDAWTLDDVDVYEHGELADLNPAAYTVIEAARQAHGKSMQAYLIFMAVRLLEMHRILKPAGSIYLHCDPTANHYLKMLMDGIFGKANFQNEIIWRRTRGRSDAHRFGRVHDTILFYAGDGATWNAQTQPHDPAYVERSYQNRDARGRWQSADLTASGLRSGESGKPWRGVNPGDRGNHWRTPTQGGMSDFIVEHNLIPGWPHAYPSLHARLDALDAADLIVWPKKTGGMPRLKRYLESTKGVSCDDVVVDIGPLQAKSAEKTGYPTQKPLALLERIIRASSNSGDLVFDPFCGCATTLVAAERLQRQWAGIDLSPLAIKLVNERIAEERGLWGGANALDTPPMRTDLGALPGYRTHRHRLYGEQEGICAGCDTHFPFKIMEVDHILPQIRGGTDHPDNLQLLCSACNRSKGRRTMAEWRAAQAG